MAVTAFRRRICGQVNARVGRRRQIVQRREGFAQRRRQDMRVVEVLFGHSASAEVLVDDHPVALGCESHAVDARDVEGKFSRIARLCEACEDP